MVSLSVNWLQKIKAMGYDAVRATSIGKSWVLQIGTQELYTVEVFDD
jgi:hypothetical protein